VLVLNPGDVIPDQVVCLDTPVNIVFSGIDVDETEGNHVFLYDNTVGASSVFSPPLNAIQSTFFDAASRVRQTMISLLIGKGNGFTRDDFGLPLSPRSRRLCVYMVDDSFAVYGRYGDWPHMGYSSEVSCFLLTFASPPEFLGSFIGQVYDLEWPPLDMSPYPFNLVFRNESIDPVISVGLGRSVVISFLAADSNPADSISFLIREDPGLPSSNASVLPVKCIPRKVFDAEIPGGFAMAPCSLAAVSVSWAILLERLPASASNGQFSVPPAFPLSLCIFVTIGSGASLLHRARQQHILRRHIARSFSSRVVQCSWLRAAARYRAGSFMERALHESASPLSCYLRGRRLFLPLHSRAHQQRFCSH
jgi:hypothetical protein